MIKQLIAGYSLDFLKDLIQNINGEIDWKNCARFLSYFELDTTEDFDNDNKTPEIAVINNLLSRGTPTKPSTYIEKVFEEAFRWTSFNIQRKIGSFSYELVSKSEPNRKKLLNALAIVDPRLHPKTNSEDRLEFRISTWEVHPDSDAEENFLYEKSCEIADGEYIIQLIEPQRKIESILNFSGIKKERFDARLINADRFYEQRADFVIQLPEAINNENKNGLVIEIDGFQHSEATQKNLDEVRDNTVRELGWFATQRIETSQLNNIPNNLSRNIKEFLKHPIINVYKDNYQNPLFNNEDGLTALELALSPFAIARIQKVLLELISYGHLDLNIQRWKIAVIERDVPCAFFAMNDLKKQIENLYRLEKKDIKFPDIDFRVFNTKEFKDCKLNLNESTITYDDNYQLRDFQADVLIDISVLQRRGLTKPSESFISNLGNPKVYIIRSSYAPATNRILDFAEPIYYPNIIDDDGICKNIKPLKYFLRNIFRKIGFRGGQLEILNRALQRKSVIALLPTGAGKSLAYQFASLLQPGITLVIDPIKSLMKDQNDNLIAVGIDNTTFINSTIKKTEIRKERLEKLSKGFYQFVFISPERLQIDEFRETLNEMADNDIGFVYCVIDEAHCVSEWGHDFRTAYLKLGENTRKYCTTADGEPIPLLGLTGTASYDVLSDVRRELGLENDPLALIRPKSSERKELLFKVINVDNSHTTGLIDFQLREEIGRAKQEKLIFLLNNIPKEFNKSITSFYTLQSDKTKAGLIFCPHVGWEFGVINVASKVKTNIEELMGITGIYAGKLDDYQRDINILEQTQDKFKNNELGLLVATKAFGMGIDKPNIRYTVHFNMPPSIEAFYQEAGRAGRDRDSAICYILYCDDTIINTEGDNIAYDRELLLAFHRNSFKGQEKEKRILQELLAKIYYPRRKKIDEISDFIRNEYELPIRLNTYFTEHVNRLYINGEEFGQTYGYINLNDNNLTINTTNEILPSEQSDELIKNVKTHLMDSMPEGENFIEWLGQINYPEPADGIEKILEQMDENSLPQTLTVGFENDRIKRISDILIQINNQYTEGYIRKKTDFCSSFESFNININRPNLNNNNLNSIKKHFNEIRREQDTFKAVYRLSIIGAIEEYSVDYRSKNVILTFKKHPDEYYIEQLQKYISRYVSREKALTFPKDVLERPGQTIIQKCLGYLIDFIYKNIAKKRKQAINVMEDGCKIALKHGNDEFRLFVNTYFDSKYYVPLSEFLNEYSLEQLWDFMDETEGVKDNLLHLRGACDRLSVENPENGLYSMLKVVANMLLYEDEVYDNIKYDIRNGWKMFIKDCHLSHKDYTFAVTEFYNKVTKYNSKIRDFLDREILYIHYIWVKENLN